MNILYGITCLANIAVPMASSAEKTYYWRCLIEQMLGGLWDLICSLFTRTPLFSYNDQVVNIIMLVTVLLLFATVLIQRRTVPMIAGAIVFYWGWYWSGCLSLIAILCGILYSYIAWESYRKKEKTLRTLLPIIFMVISILLIIWAINRLAAQG